MALKRNAEAAQELHSLLRVEAHSLLRVEAGSSHQQLESLYPRKLVQSMRKWS